MKLSVSVALVALAGLSVPAMAQSAPPSPEVKKVTRMACKNEAVTGSFTRKARQCRHAVTTTVVVKPTAHDAAHAQPAPAAAAAATATPPASATTATGNDTKGQ